MTQTSHLFNCGFFLFVLKYPIINDDCSSIIMTHFHSLIKLFNTHLLLSVVIRSVTWVDLMN